LALGVLRRLAVDLVDLDQREVALAVLGRTNFALDRVAGVQVEAADLRRRDVDVVGSGEIPGVRRAQEAEGFGQYLQRAVAVDGDPRWPDFGRTYCFAPARRVSKREERNGFDSGCQIGWENGIKSLQVLRQRRQAGKAGCRGRR